MNIHVVLKSLAFTKIKSKTENIQGRLKTAEKEQIKIIKNRKYQLKLFDFFFQNRN